MEEDPLAAAARKSREAGAAAVEDPTSVPAVDGGEAIPVWPVTLVAAAEIGGATAAEMPAGEAETPVASAAAMLAVDRATAVGLQATWATAAAETAATAAGMPADLRITPAAAGATDVEMAVDRLTTLARAAGATAAETAATGPARTPAAGVGMPVAVARIPTTTRLEQAAAADEATGAAGAAIRSSTA